MAGRWFLSFALLGLLASAGSGSAWAGGFVRTGDLNIPRAEAISVKLADGRVLVAGGITTGGVITRTAEIYDPASGTFTLVPGQMAIDRTISEGVLLGNGKVLIVGGQAANAGPWTSAELFDPATGQFTAVPNQMSGNRVWPLVVRLNNGKVLVSHGCCTGGTNADLYDPTTGLFAPTAFPPSSTFGHATGNAITLLSGKVLLAGDWGSREAQVYDPVADNFTTTAGQMVAQRDIAAASRLNDGRVLFVGGASDPTNKSAEIFDPSTGTFSATAGNASDPRTGSYIAPLPDGRVLVAGGTTAWAGVPNDTADIFDPSTGTFTPTPDRMAVPRRQLGASTAVVLDDGRILIAGGAIANEATLNRGTVVSELYVPDPPVAPNPGSGGSDLPTEDDKPQPSSPPPGDSESGAPSGLPVGGPASSVKMRLASGSSRLTVRLWVPGPGTIVQRGVSVGLGSAGTATATACRSSRKVRSSGTIRIGCRLSAATAKRLRDRSLRMRVTLTFRPYDGANQSATRLVRVARTTPRFTG